jgi:hypothetical protein
MRKDRLISLVVAVVWLIAAFTIDFRGGGTGSVKDRLALPGLALVALVLIWFGDELGEFTGMTSRGNISQQSPGWLVKLFGWVLLLGLIGLWLYSVAVGPSVSS